MKRLLAALGISLGLLLGTAPASGNIIVSFAPSSQHVNVGDTVSVDVFISGLGAEILSAFDLNFRYNPLILQWSVINGSSALNQLGGAYGTDPIFVFDSLVNGDLGIQAGALVDDATVAANQADSFLLFHFELTGLTNGVTTFGLGPDLDFERNFVGLDALSLQVDIGSACIAVGTGVCRVPEPGSIALLALGLLLVNAFRARRLRH